MNKLLICFFLILPGIFAFCQNDVRIRGSIYYQERSPQKMAKFVKNYATEVKVFLIHISMTGFDRQDISDHKKNICNNDPAYISKYSPMVEYTDKNGNYEFSGLTPNNNYMLIVCDNTIQLSIISTSGKRKVTYNVKDKVVNL